MKTLTFQVTDELYEAFQQIAAKNGRTLEEVALEWLAKRAAQRRRPQWTEEERQAARERFRRHAGAVNLGYATGANNESIDADLAREYGSTHEEEG
jgi:predicted transcriptional regulator